MEKPEQPQHTHSFNPLNALASMIAIHEAFERSGAEIVSVGFVARAMKPFSGTVRLVATPLASSDQSAESPQSFEATLPFVLS